MKPETRYLLLKTVQDKGILPVSSVCNMACQFCSHRNNPPGLDVYRLGHLDLSLMKELLEYLPADGPLIIGESATRIIEGDPLAHPQFLKIIEMIRGFFPEKEIKITTHGSFLNPEVLKMLQENMPVELNISLNCSSPEERAFLMADKKPEQVFSALEILAVSPIKFNGSIVAVPHLLGWQSLDKTISLLDEYNAETIRVFMPGFTRFSEEKMKFEVDTMYKRLASFIDKYDECRTPVLLEPPQLNNFDCVIKGIIRNSPAGKTLLKKGDIIISVNQEKVLSRVDGFNKVLKAENPLIKIRRGGTELELLLEKRKGERSGLIVDYDFSVELLDRLSRILLNNLDRKTAIISSVLGKDIMNSFLKNFKTRYNLTGLPVEIDLLVAENRFFAGSIMSAGLLTNGDIISCLEESGKSYQKIILPGIMFDVFGNDLKGKNYREIEQLFDIKIDIV